MEVLAERWPAWYRTPRAESLTVVRFSKDNAAGIEPLISGLSFGDQRLLNSLTPLPPKSKATTS